MKLLLADTIAPDVSELVKKYESIKIVTNCLQVDLADDQSVEAMLQDSPVLLVHSAAVVSGDAEENFEKGYQVNVDGSRLVLEAIRAANPKNRAVPRLDFSSR